MRDLRFLILGASLLVMIPTTFAAEISANVTLASDYVYRGISQTDEEASIQGGFDLETDNGFYAGIWGSNIAFDGAIEIDLYFGYGGEITEDLSYDVGFLHYDYPNQPEFLDDGVTPYPDSNFDEVYGSLSYKGVTLGLALSDDFFAESGSAEYVYIDYELGLPNDFTLAFHYGDQSIDCLDCDYKDYSISVSKSFADVDVALGWYDTDISKVNIADSRVVLSFAKSL